MTAGLDHTPPDYSELAREEVKEQLTRVILRLLAENNALHYYQGLHDIVITLLLVLGEELCHAVMETLVTFHIRCVCGVESVSPLGGGTRGRRCQLC